MSSEVNRSIGAEEAARLAARQSEVNKAKKSEKAGEFAAQQKAVGDKKLKSSFDEMLNKMSDPALPVGQEAKFDSRLKEIQRDQDQSSSEHHKDDEKKPGEKTETGKKTKDSSESTHERVVAKHQGGGNKQDSGSGGGEERGGGQGGRGFHHKSSSAQAYGAELKKDQLNPAPVPEMPRIQSTQLQGVEGAEAPREMPKAVLDQIVQYVRVGVNKDLNKEMEIDFKDNFFNGLRLKVTSNGKEVSVEFIVPNRAVKQTFMQERENIALALGEKGIDCGSILVTMS